MTRQRSEQRRRHARPAHWQGRGRANGSPFWELRRGWFQRGWFQNICYCKLCLRCSSAVCQVVLRKTYCFETSPMKQPPMLVPTIVKKARIIAGNHFSQLASHEGPLSRCEVNPRWAIMGRHGLFLTTDYNIWFLDL